MKRIVLTVISAVLFLGGVALTILYAIKLSGVGGSSLDASMVSMGIGIISVAVAGFAFLISMNSDDRMKAISNLEFDEKASMLEHYENIFRAGFDKNEFEMFRWTSEAISHVAKWATKSKRQRAAESIDTITNLVATSITKDSIDRLKKLVILIRPKMPF